MKKQTQPPPAIFKFFSADQDEKIWYYLDLQNKLQGAFSAKMMDEWYSNGHLPMELKVTLGRNNEFRTLRDLADTLIQNQIME